MTDKERQLRFSWPEIGHERLCLVLDRAIESGNLAQSYIFVGPEGIGKSTIAAAFARNLIASRSQADVADELPGSYSDLMVVEREEGKKNISVEQVRALIHRLNLSSFLDSYKIGIVKDAQTLSLEGANALLKTLEEPRENCIIILLAVSLENIPSTLVSRSALFRFYPVARETVYDHLLAKGATRSQAKEISALSWGKPLLAERYLDDREVLESAIKPAEGLLSYLESGLMPNDSELDVWLGQGGFNEEAAVAESLLASWETLLRDLGLVSVSSPELITYTRFLPRIEALARLISGRGDSVAAYAVRAAKQLEDAQEMIWANVGARRAINCALANIEI